MSLEVVPVAFATVREFIARNHRHNTPPRGWKFGCGVAVSGELVGVVSAGRPVSREIQKREPCTLEVNRTCTDGTRNANSMLYGAIWRAAKALGYLRCITYTQSEEDGASLRAAGWVRVKELPARGSWADHSQQLRQKRDPVGNGGVPRALWEIRR
jgi:hypothetical protein